MSKVGYLNIFNNGNYEELNGEIKTLAFQRSIRLIPDSMRTNESAPNYIVYAENNGVYEIQIGVAWKKYKLRKDNTTLNYLSLVIDDHSLPEPFKCAAFPNDNSGFDISWTRSQNIHSAKN